MTREVKKAGKSKKQTSLLLVHFSEDSKFIPATHICSVEDFNGCWFYQCPTTEIELKELQSAWPGRFRSFWLISDEFVEEVQTFSSEETGNRFEITELFVKSGNLDKLVWAKEPDLA